mgnify:CR=1 FL=1
MRATSVFSPVGAAWGVCGAARGRATMRPKRATRGAWDDGEGTSPVVGLFRALFIEPLPRKDGDSANPQPSRRSESDALRISAGTGLEGRLGRVDSTLMSLTDCCCAPAHDTDQVSDPSSSHQPTNRHMRLLAGVRWAYRRPFESEPARDLPSTLTRPTRLSHSECSFPPAERARLL